MTGIIRGFLGGASKGMADAGQMLLANKLNSERDEAADLRRRALNMDTQSSRQEFLGADTDKKIAATSSENALDRANRENVASTNAKAKSVDDKPTTNMKDAASLQAQGYPADVANAVAHGALKQIKDEDTGDMVLINSLNNTPVGRLTSGGPGGAKIWLPEGQDTENATVSSANRKQAGEATSEKAGWLSTDSTDFPETGGDREAWRKKEAQRLANEERAAKKGGGIVNSAVDINRSTPQTAMPKPKQSAPKAALDAVMKDNSLLPQFIQKYGYDPTKQ